MEDYAYVLDVLPEGRPDSKRRFRREPLVYGLGVEEFKIFDMQPVTDAAINIGDKCYIGKETEERTQIDHVRARVNYSDLTHTAQSELSFVLDEIVKDNEEKLLENEMRDRLLENNQVNTKIINPPKTRRKYVRKKNN